MFFNPYYEAERFYKKGGKKRIVATKGESRFTFYEYGSSSEYLANIYKKVFTDYAVAVYNIGEKTPLFCR